MAHELKFGALWGYNGSKISALRDGDYCYPVGTALVMGNVHSGRQHHFWNPRQGRPTGPVAFNPRQTMFVFSELSDSPLLYVYSYPDNIQLQDPIRGGTQLEYSDMAFSRNGLQLCTLGSLPDFNLSVYAVDPADKKLTLTVRTSAMDHQAKSVSFNPAVKDELITSGSGHITFWKMEKAQAGVGLVAAEGKLSSHHVRITSHCHAPNGEALGGTNHGDIYRFDSATGYGEPWWENPGGASQGRDAVVALNVTRHHVISTSLDGIMRFFRHESRVIEKSISLSASYVRNVVITPEWNSLIVGCGDGLVFNVHIPGYESPQLTPEDFKATKERTWAVSDYCGGVVTGLCHLARGNIVVSVSEDSTMRVWDYRRNALIGKMEIGQRPSSCAAGSGVSEHLVAVGSETSHLRIVELKPDTLDREPPRVMMQEKLADRGEVSLVSFSEDGTMLVALVQSVGLFFVRIEGREMYNILGHLSTVECPCKDLIWVEGERDQILTAHVNGDIRLLVAPSVEAEDESGELSADLVQSLWKLDFPVERMRLGRYMEEMYQLVVLSRDKETKIYQLDKQQKAADAGKVAAKKPQSAWKDHEKLGSAAIVTTDKQFLFSSGADGKIVLRDLSNRGGDKAKWSVQRHACFSTSTSKGGIQAMVSSPDQRWFVTAGGDGNIAVWTWGHQSPQVPMSIANQTELSELPDEEDVYLVRRQKDCERMLAIKHQGHRDEVISKIESLREQLQAYKQENQLAESDEKLDVGEFMIPSQREELRKQGDELCEAKAEDIKWQNLTHDYVRDKIEKECYECMNEHLVVVKPIREERGETIQVPNYSINKVDPRELRILKKVKFLRRVEQIEWERRGYEVLSDLHEPEMIEVDGQMVPKPKPKAAAQEKEEAKPESDGKEEKKDAGATLAAEAREKLDPLFYNKYLVFTRSRTLTQIQLLRREVLNLQLDFNEKVKGVLQAKKQGIQAINDTINKKIRVIQKELQVTDPVPDMKASQSEKPDRILTVHDSEIKSKRHLSPEEQKKYDEEQEKERRRKAEAEDGSVTRALQEMMDGRLERDERQVKEIKMPTFGQEGHKDYKITEEWTDEEQKAWADYEKKKQKQLDEEQRHRMELAAELKELRKDLKRIEDEFEKTLQQTFEEKLCVDTAVYERELQIIKLAQGIIQQEEMEAHSVKLAKLVEDVRGEANKSQGIVNESSSELQKTQIRYEQEAEQEKRKAGDKDLKTMPPFNEAEEFSDTLIKLLKKTTRPKREKGKKEKKDKREEPVNPDPFTWVDEEEEDKRKKAVVDTSDLPKLEKPEGLREDIWSEFNRYRIGKMESERNLKLLQDELVERRRAHEKIQRESRQHQLRLEEQQKTLDQFRTQMLHEFYNLDVLHTFRQGQIEVEQEAVVTDYADAILIHKKDIEHLNGQIREHGQGKVNQMREMMDFKKEIRYIEWENEMLDQQSQHYEMDLRHLLTLRVTKAMQEFIKGGQENHHEIERAKLLKKIDHVQKTMQGKIDEKKVMMLKVKRVIREKESENAVLSEQVKEAQQLVGEREEIQHLQSTGLDHQRNLKLMKDMRVTRKLEDVAKAQQEEMQLLKKEIDRLRERTFPSFAVVSKRVVGNPDQL